MRHINKQKRNVHPADRTLSPQVFVQDGQIKVFDAEDEVKQKDALLGKNIRYTIYGQTLPRFA